MRSPEQKVTLQVLRQSDTTIRVTPFKEGSALESTIKTSRVCPFHSGLVADRAREILGLLARANLGVPGLLDDLVDESKGGLLRHAPEHFFRRELPSHRTCPR